MEYNKQQQEVIDTIEGPLVVISCAGSGKTAVLIERAKKMIDSGISAQKILVATFSRAAAVEMQERFQKECGAYQVKFATIHSVCFSILARANGLNATAILKESEKKNFLYQKYMELKKEYGKDFTEHYKDMDDFCNDAGLKITRFMYSMYRNELNYTEVTDNVYEKQTLRSYLEFKTESGKVDFDDMIIQAHKCLKNNQDALEYWRGVFEYIMIDEYQDTSTLQAEIFFMLAKAKNICVVGDDDQSIYSFRDVDGRIFQRFLQEYQNAKIVKMETNYRSRKQIVNAAKNIIEHNQERFSKDFKADRKGHAKIQKFIVDDNIHQAKKVVELVREYEKKNILLKDIAILYRINKEASIICNRFLAEEIPFYTRELPENIYNGMVYQDVKAYYRLANELWGRTDLHRIINRPKRYIKAEAVLNCGLDKDEIIRRCIQQVEDGTRKEQINRTIEKLFQDLRNLRGKSPVQVMQYLRDNMGYRDALEEYADFLRIEKTKFTTDFDILIEEAERFATMMEWDIYVEAYEENLRRTIQQNKETGVQLSTFHSAKGLQWKNVIIISANDGTTPLMRKEQIENGEEERRLFYVAVTRAEDELAVIHFKEGQGTTPSRYIAEMGKLK